MSLNRDPWRVLDRMFWWTFGFAVGGMLSVGVILWLLHTGELIKP